jgi:hypothetical protein
VSGGKAEEGCRFVTNPILEREAVVKRYNLSRAPACAACDTQPPISVKRSSAGVLAIVVRLAIWPTGSLAHCWRIHEYHV